MAASRTERRVFLWRVVPRVKPAAAADRGKAATLDEIISILEAAQSAGTAKAYVAAGGGLLDEDGDDAPDPKNQIYIAEIKRDPARGIVTLLINRGDPNAASPAFLDMLLTGGVRVENPRPPEAQGWSAHLCISMTAVGGAYRGCFEKMPGLSASLVLAALERILARELATNPAYRYEVVKKAGGKTTIEHKPYHPVLEVERAPSERLINDLKNGELSSITLTRSTAAYAGPGMAKLVTRQERKLVLHTAKADASAVEGLVRDVMSFAKEKKYQRVTFHLDNLPGGMSNQPTIDIETADALEVLYVRAQRLHGFSTILLNAYSSTCLHIEEKMVEVIVGAEGW